MSAHAADATDVREDFPENKAVEYQGRHAAPDTTKEVSR